MIKTPRIGRRRILHGLAATVLAPSLPAFAQTGRTLTPAQTEGPFYPPDWTGDIDNDLVRVQGEAAQAMGTITHVQGRILDRSGQPISNAVVEIWQCDAHGVYRHPRSGGGSRDPGFQGRGRVASSADGSYAFRTIRPVAYPGRTPHIHFHIEAPDHDGLTTQMYVAGEPLNDRDGVLMRIPAADRDSVIVRLDNADGIEPGALAGEFNIVLG